MFPLRPQQFVTCPNWAHIDIAGVMQDSSGIGSLGKGGYITWVYIGVYLPKGGYV